MLTTNATAILLHSIIGGVAVSRKRSQSIMTLLEYSPNPSKFSKRTKKNHLIGILGSALTQNSKIWSKTGWASRVRHDAAYIEIPDKFPYLLVVFTEGEKNARNEDMLPFISQQFMHNANNL
ncbi:hypothetical protein RINTHH_9220 [Richelia intracellularis HH01]|uniref:Beta-lactamase class A catalytic domain-containing protein n=1 Tax=Richelia intracellularis HH01 TaxID=1165094 RepID=M1WYV5_9NOST|nr:hypothetical protein RINTHH_9220 [Richelia intracellularis HH01]